MHKHPVLAPAWTTTFWKGRLGARSFSTNVTAASKSASAGKTAAPLLTDRYGRFHNYLRVSLTERCNLRCTYCMPEGGVDLTPDQQLLTRSEVARVLGVFVSRGVDRVRFTGGEPLLRKDLPEIIAEADTLRAEGLKEIALTTNGLTLGRRVDELASAGLDSVNISLDTLDPNKFMILTRRKGLERVVASARAAADHPSGLRVKINVVVIRGVNDDDVLQFVELTKSSPIDVRFIEYMPFDGNRWASKKLVPYAELVDRIQQRYPLERFKDGSLDGPNAVSRLWHVPGWAGRVGFIASMTDHFCAGCNRLRVTADGNLKVCLFGNAETSLRDAMRSGADDDTLARIVAEALQRKKPRHGGMEHIARTTMRPMTTIGG